LYKLEKKCPGDSELKRRLQEKILQSKEALALHHTQRGKEIMESQYYEDAEEVFRLALELTENPELKNELRERLKDIRDYYGQEEITDSRGIQTEKTDAAEQDHDIRQDDYFAALVGSFSYKVREKAYHSYGEAFKEGYLALNNGDFELAVTKLSQSMEENRGPKTYIPLELATAYLNLGNSKEAERLLTGFLKDYPDSLQGYQMLCETYWEMKAFEKAEQLLQACPQELMESPLILLLQGETLFQSQRFQEAKSLFLDYLKSSGWDENIALSLAKTYETLDEKEKARDLYAEVMEKCSSCGGRIAPFIKQRYSDISLACGQVSTKILELYLSLVQEDPDNKGHYYQKIVEIYSALRNEKEARRYQRFANRP
jgi:thioredoxin-like negative regulator of GroEL